MKHEKNQPHLESQPLIILAGAAGFLGSHLAESLVAAGCQVIGLDNLSTGAKNNLSSLKSEPLFDLIGCDLTQALPKSLTCAKISHVVAAAGTSFYLGQEKKELNELLLASLGTKNLLELAVSQKATFLLLSSIDIYKGVAGSLSMEHYYDNLEIAQQLSFLEGCRFAEALTQQYCDLHDLDARVARLSTVYGPRMNLKTNHLLAKLLRLTLKQKDLIINEDGARELSLLFISDAVYGLTKLLLSSPLKTKQAIYNFLNPEPVSILSIAYTLKEFYPRQPQVEFLPKGHQIEFKQTPTVSIHRTQKELFWEPQVDLTEGLKLTLAYFSEKKARQKTAVPAPLKKELLPAPTFLEKIEDKIQQAKKGSEQEIKGWLALKKKQERKTPSIIKGLEIKKKKPVLSRLNFSKVLVLFFVFLSAFFGLPALGTITFAKLSFNNLKAKDFSAAQNQLLIAQGFWGSPPFLIFKKLPPTKNFYSSLDLILNTAFFANRSLQDLYPASLNIQKAYQIIADHSLILGGGNSEEIDQVEVLKLLKDARLGFEQGTGNFSLSLQQFQNSCLIAPDLLAKNLLNCQENLPLLIQIDNLIKAVPSLLQFSPKLLGWEENLVTYLILLQNNTELRPTGGFLGSYLVMDIDQGRITRFKVDDIYNPDGILKQKITAPAAAQKYMGVKELGIRDANWWPSFPESAEKVATLYEFATGEKISLVLALDLEVVKGLLKATGEIYLPDYQETITAENLFERTEIASEVNFEPGSTQKKDFLGNLANVLLNHLIQEGNPDWNKIGKNFLTNLSQKDILFFSRWPQLQSVFSYADWAGEIKKTTGDYLWAIDTNVGGNKANFWIKRSTSYQLDVDRDGNLIATLKLAWRHTGQSESWPGGTYKNFLRVYTPLGPQLLEQTNFSDEVATYEEFDKTVLGGLVEIPVNSQKQITLKYKLPENVGFKNSSQYSLLIQKQSGIGIENFSFKLDLPVFLNLKEGDLIWQIPLQTDLQKTITVSR